MSRSGSFAEGAMKPPIKVKGSDLRVGDHVRYGEGSPAQHIDRISEVTSGPAKGYRKVSSSFMGEHKGVHTAHPDNDYTVHR